jgi:predicted Zn-dependent protease
MKKLLFALAVTSSFALSSCSKSDGGLNVFSVDDDKNLGLQVKQEIDSDPAHYPILSRTAYAEQYNYLEAIKTDILNSGKLSHKDDFAWELYIIKDDTTLNAFCTPGGYIYVYTGLIKFLETKSSLAGVLGHEMAHADRRHSTEQLTKAYGIQTLLDVVLGKNQGLISEIAGSLVSLSFSRADESEADKYSVIFLCPTKYHSDGAAKFFQKLESTGNAANPPEFLSTHPNPDNRIQNIESEAATLGCSSTISDQEDISSYTNFKNGF